MSQMVHALFVSAGNLAIPQCLLGDETIAVLPCLRGVRAIEEIERAHPDVVILDASDDFPGQLQFFYSLRAIGDSWPTPVAALVDSDHHELILTALDAGIDECVSSTLDPREVAARIRALARRSKLVANTEKIHFADLVLDPVSLKAWRGGRLLHLTIFQFRLLQFLMTHPGRVFTRQELLREVWNEDQLDEGAVTACILRLRRALTSSVEKDLIRSARGVGYALDDDAELQQ
jgi:two-component system phosphate regulon response regulator PhoB